MLKLRSAQGIHSRMTFDYLDILKKEFDSRKRINQNYSLRAFARDLELSPSRLSEVLSNKSGLSEKTAEKVAKKIRLSPSETKLFVELVNKKHARSSKARQNAHDYLESNFNKNSISLDGFRVISDWYYFAILSVMELDECNGKAEWIAKRMGLDIEITLSALKTLHSLDYVSEADSAYHLLKNNLTTTHDIKSYALRNYHKQNLQRSMESLDTVDVELRDITSMTMTFERSRMKEAKEMLKDFRRMFCQKMEDGKKEEVYSLNIQFVPLTQRGE